MAHQVGAAFKVNPKQREGCKFSCSDYTTPISGLTSLDTDFLAAGGPNGYAWNVVRSESDDLMFQHAQKCGAKVFDGVKVDEINFAALSPTTPKQPSLLNHERPVSATWSSRSDGKSGTLSFEYIVDASGRAGVLNKYNKSRKYNQGLNNVASWGYWENTDAYAVGSERENSPYFEALTGMCLQYVSPYLGVSDFREGLTRSLHESDESGWAWFIPLHNGTTSVGIVMKQELSKYKKKQMPTSTSAEDFYRSSLELVPNLSKLLGPGKLVTDIKHASDYSYSSSSYASPFVRVVGDAGCFIDPFFSSGVHLALVGGLSAATTICAAIRGDCEESVAAKWHSNKIADGYARFLLVVLSAYRQMRRQDEYLLSDFGADNVDDAFAFFKPVIQGTADSTNAVSHTDLSRTIDFCAQGFGAVDSKERASIFQRMTRSISAISNGAGSVTCIESDRQNKLKVFRDSLDPEEQRVMDYIRARQLLRTEDTMHIGNFATDVIDGLAPRLERGRLTLVDATSMPSTAKTDVETTQTIG
ncbi:hypothetical protein Q9189_002281 [Teloschistes chrysophthalmus]